MNDPGFARNRAASAEHGVDVDARRVRREEPWPDDGALRGARDELRQAWYGARSSERTARVGAHGEENDHANRHDARSPSALIDRCIDFGSSLAGKILQATTAYADAERSGSGRVSVGLCGGGAGRVTCDDGVNDDRHVLAFALNVSDTANAPHPLFIAAF